MELQCQKCKEVKPVSEFWKATYRSTGYQAQCKACQKAHQREKRDYSKESDRRTKWRENNADKVREQSRKAQARHREKQAALMAEFKEWLAQRKEASV